ncbi:MAG: sigma-54-dependent Fis family transcriptional regulator, partial [Lentimicrobium sp.]|nr:sigma-54-dependent Fis family transcriptional regulator [Lentimicrobium sp.]
NITEQISIIEESRLITSANLQRYLPSENRDLPVLYHKEQGGGEFSEREILYKVLFDMKRDIGDLKKLVVDIIEQGGVSHEIQHEHQPIIAQLYKEFDDNPVASPRVEVQPRTEANEFESFYTTEVLDESLSIQKKEIDLIKRAIEKHGGKRKNAALELGISERTLYRKIKEYGLS